MDDSTDSALPQESSKSQRDQLADTDAGALISATVAPTVKHCPYLSTGEPLPLTGKAILRPALEVTLLDGSMQPAGRFPALVDSGADFTTLSDEWAAPLGIDVERDCEREKVGVMDEQPSWRYSYGDGLNIEVAGELMFLPLVKFCKKPPFSVLGRKDFFDRYLVLFDNRSRCFFLERLPDPDEDDDPDDDAEPEHELVLN